jgi:hypothetical protein
MAKSTRLWRHVAVSLIAAGPAGGFLFGILNAGDPDPNPIGRAVYAFMMAVQTPLHGGFPPHDPTGTGTGRSGNAWPHIVVSFLVVLGWLGYRDWKLARRQSEPRI